MERVELSEKLAAFSSHPINESLSAQSKCNKNSSIKNPMDRNKKLRT